MKKYFKKIKTNLVALWIAIISFPSKVLAHPPHYPYDMQFMQTFYWIERPSDMEILEPAESTIDIIIKSAPRLLIAITFIVWIVSFIKIRRIDDKTVRRKRIKKAIIIISILVILIIALIIKYILLIK